MSTTAQEAFEKYYDQLDPYGPERGTQQIFIDGFNAGAAQLAALKEENEQLDDVYTGAVDTLEAWHEKRAKARLPMTCQGSVIDGIASLCHMIETLEEENERLRADNETLRTESAGWLGAANKYEADLAVALEKLETLEYTRSENELSLEARVAELEGLIRDIKARAAKLETAGGRLCNAIFNLSQSLDLPKNKTDDLVRLYKYWEETISGTADNGSGGAS